MLTQPQNITKGTPAEFILNKIQLASLVPNGNYFSDTTNWRQLVIHYQSTGSHKQNIFVRMDANVSSPVGDFKSSTRAQDIFKVIYVTIYDFDGGKYTVNRNLLPVSEFDVSL